MRATYAGVSHQTVGFQVLTNVLFIEAPLLFAYTDRRWPETRAFGSSIVIRRQRFHVVDP